MPTGLVAAALECLRPSSPLGEDTTPLTSRPAAVRLSEPTASLEPGPVHQRTQDLAPFTSRPALAFGLAPPTGGEVPTSEPLRHGPHLPVGLH